MLVTLWEAVTLMGISISHTCMFYLFAWSFIKKLEEAG
jgi:hypothetical protein